MTVDAKGAAHHGPLDGFEWSAGMRETPPLTQLNVRLDPRDMVAVVAVQNAIGCELPTAPNTASGDPDGRYALWLGPDEWLAIAPAADRSDCLRTLEGAIGASLVTVVDVSASRTTIELWGDDAREVLEAGCPIDLHPRSFGPGRCAQTLVGRIPGIVHQISAEPRFRLGVRISFAGHLAAWLSDAASGVRGSGR